jgi:hypothetical protein
MIILFVASDRLSLTPQAMDEGRIKNRGFFAFSVERNSVMDGAIRPTRLRSQAFV